MKSKPKYQFLLTALLIGAFVNIAHAETTVGRWCDKQIPTMPKYNGIMAIVITDDGAVELRMRWGDGSSLVTKLSEQGGGIYAAVGSSSGDKYRVVPADGNLQLLDNDGLIRVAIRLENTPQPGDCGI